MSEKSYNGDYLNILAVWDVLRGEIYGMIYTSPLAAYTHSNNLGELSQISSLGR